MKRMRLKYYLRALGIGIIVTALLMGYSQSSQAEMTDEEILRRAAELGMPEPQTGVLAEIATASPKPVEEAEPTAAPTAEPTAKPTAAPTAKPTAAPTAKPTAAPTAAPTAKPTAAPTAKPTTAPAGDTVTLVISRGESSVTVSKNL
ncbi:MAG: PT domain-containing protein, partial [Acetatifactor sp.]|nr:PT domain-containing protein [Acetatifactor sp.]